MAVLEARNLSVSLGGVEMLRDVSFTLERGRVLGLVGESGAGKSMLGRVIARNLPAGFSVSGGGLAFEGQDLVTIGDDDRRRLLGRPHRLHPAGAADRAEPRADRRPAIRRASRPARRCQGRAARPRHRRAGRCQAAAIPQALLERYSFQLSGGMCQRVLIAMAFASEPALIVADEPTTALDVSTQAHIVQIIRSMQRDHGTALLFITHDLRLAAHVCDDILVLYAGDMVERGPARAVSQPRAIPIRARCRPRTRRSAGACARSSALPDQMPGIGAFAGLPGCRFAPRCPSATRPAPASSPPCGRSAPGHWPCGAPTAASRALPASSKPHRSDAAAPPPGDVVLTLNRVSKHTPANATGSDAGGPARTAVKPMDLTVRAGEFVGIVGESRVRQEHRRRLVMGLEPLTTGSIAIDGKDVSVNDPGRAQRQARHAADGVPGPTIRPEPATPGRPPHHAVAGSVGSHASEAERVAARPCAARRNGPAARSARRASPRSLAAASASASTSRGRCASRRGCWWRTRSSRRSTCRCRRRS